MKEYKLLEAYSAEELSDKVSEHLNNGFGIVGNPIITERLKNGVELTEKGTNYKVVYYSQAVIKIGEI